ncbi:unnamed protein product, partial [Prorocentrum cordatum]
LFEFGGGRNLLEMERSPGSAGDGDQQFLVQCSKLLEDLPGTCARKYGEQHLDSTEGRARLLVGLVKEHSGELVELDRRGSGWEVRAVAPGSASAALTQGSEQWLCCDGGAPAGKVDAEFGHHCNIREIALHTEDQARGLASGVSA